MTSPPKIQLTEKHKQTLRDLAITETAPGSVVHDFEILLEMAHKAPMHVTTNHQLLMKTFKPLNERLVQPIQLGLKRPQQKSYPVIHGLYLLLRASGLAIINMRGKKPTLHVDEDLYTQWLALNATEKYFSLLEAWLMRGYGEIIGEAGRDHWGVPDNMGAIIEFVEHHNLHKEKSMRVTATIKNDLIYRPGMFNLGLLHVFGWFSFETAAPAPDGQWNITSLRLTPTGSAFLGVFHEEILSLFEQSDQLGDAEVEIEGKTTQELFQPYFPELQTLVQPPEIVFQEGAHIFKVSLSPDIWRRIAIDAHQVFDDLASAILASVDFDDDHLYQFTYSNRIGTTVNINHPNLEEGDYSDEIRIGEIGLEIGQEILFIFDFGDFWQFNLLLEAIDPAQPITGYEIRESHGEAPKQYAYDEEGYIVIDSDELNFFFDDFMDAPTDDPLNDHDEKE